MPGVSSVSLVRARERLLEFMPSSSAEILSKVAGRFFEVSQGPEEGRFFEAVRLGEAAPERGDCFTHKQLRKCPERLFQY
jgi:hypothetical protein